MARAPATPPKSSGDGRIDCAEVALCRILFDRCPSTTSTVPPGFSARRLPTTPGRTGASPKTPTWNASRLCNGSTSNTWHYRSGVPTSTIPATAPSQSCRRTLQSQMKRPSRRSSDCTEIGSSAFFRLTNNCLRFPSRQRMVVGNDRYDAALTRNRIGFCATETCFGGVGSN